MSTIFGIETARAGFKSRTWLKDGLVRLPILGVLGAVFGTGGELHAQATKQSAPIQMSADGTAVARSVPDPKVATERRVDLAAQRLVIPTRVYEVPPPKDWVSAPTGTVPRPLQLEVTPEHPEDRRVSVQIISRPKNQE